MTDNTEREAFEKVCPVPWKLKWIKDKYVHDDYIWTTETAIYNAKWEGFQLGLAGEVRRLEAEIERLTAELAAAKAELAIANKQTGRSEDEVQEKTSCN